MRPRWMQTFPRCCKSLFFFSMTRNSFCCTHGVGVWLWVGSSSLQCGYLTSLKGWLHVTELVTFSNQCPNSRGLERHPVMGKAILKFRVNNESIPDVVHWSTSQQDPRWHPYSKPESPFLRKCNSAEILYWEGCHSGSGCSQLQRQTTFHTHRCLNHLNGLRLFFLILVLNMYTLVFWSLFPKCHFISFILYQQL